MKGEVSNSCTGISTKCEVSYPGKKDEISPMVSPLRDDFHINGDDDMAKVRAMFLTIPSFSSTVVND